jgi:hypothetical protein
MLKAKVMKKMLSPKSQLVPFAPYRGHSFWQKGRGFAEGQNVAKQPSDLWQSDLPRRSRSGEGGSRSVKVNQSDFFCSKCQAVLCKYLYMRLLQNIQWSNQL